MKHIILTAAILTLGLNTFAQKATTKPKNKPATVKTAKPATAKSTAKASTKAEKGTVKDAKAAEILKKVSAKYKSFGTLKADFSYTLQNPSEKINETQTGTIHLKSTKYRVAIAGQEIICDNKTRWTYIKDSKEVMVNNAANAEADMNPAEIFTMYEKGYSYLFVEEKTIGGVMCQIIDLTPNDKTKQYFKVRLTVDKKQSQLLQSNIFDKNGSHYIYKITKFTPNPKLEDAFFNFDAKKYPGVEVVDMR